MGVDNGGMEMGEEMGNQEKEEKRREGEKGSFYISMAGSEGKEKS